jgi:2-polyprenyl-3-methyl-5-hydroxy-6-metoxy-1,4-benzoquinol methylase
MQNNISDLVSNTLELDESSVWVLDKTRKFGYSDGAESEQYLRKVLSESSDISSNSYELETYIKDWNSEYHLSRKRAQLLKGFNYDRSKKVLEVGCGCGAITRFLGETFDNVTAIEGSIARAGIARMRTKDLDNVSIICAPFQEIKFKEKFDIIFCIGVFEYSNMFVDHPEPYDYILKYFYEILNPGGEIVIAIENQFGLKYFSSSTEDHSAVMFDGLEGYPRFRGRNAKTFGYNELSNLIHRYFRSIQYYFPFPDYKMPSCILSEQFLNKADVGEMVGGFYKQTNYLGDRKPLFDEKLVWLEIDKNKMTHFFSNSFLVFASKSDMVNPKLDVLGLIYSENRVEKFQTITKFLDKSNNEIFAHKYLINGKVRENSNCISLSESQTKWINGLSLHTQMLKLSKDKNLTLNELFEPAIIWINTLRAKSELKDGVLTLDGKYIDCIWKNSYIIGGECEFIDIEWTYIENFTLNRLVIKSLFEYLNDVTRMSDLNPLLTVNSKMSFIIKVASTLGIKLHKNDFEMFIETESKIAEVVNGHMNTRLWKYYINLELKNRALANGLLRNFRLLKRISNKVRNLVNHSY